MVFDLFDIRVSTTPLGVLVLFILVTITALKVHRYRRVKARIKRAFKKDE